MARLHIELSGNGENLLVLLHGMGTTGSIWSPFIAARPLHWPGRILALDLPGHGSSVRLEDYAIAAVAAEVASAVQSHLPDSAQYRVLGHSYGGVVALALAGLSQAHPPEYVYGLGIKTVWTAAERDGVQRLAGKPPKLFSDAVAAREWYRKVSGIAGLEAGVECATRGVAESASGHWHLAQDPKVHAFTPPDMAALTGGLRGRFSLAYGADDTMVDAADLARIDPAVHCLEGGGHNIMVSHPAAVWRWLAETP